MRGTISGTISADTTPPNIVLTRRGFDSPPSSPPQASGLLPSILSGSPHRSCALPGLLRESVLRGRVHLVLCVSPASEAYADTVATLRVGEESMPGGEAFGLVILPP
jgi:hypothetical protein